MSWSKGDWVVYKGSREVKVLAQMGDYDLYRVEGVWGEGDKKGQMVIADVDGCTLSPITFPVGTTCWYEGDRMEIIEIMWNGSRKLKWLDRPDRRHPQFGTCAFKSQLSLVDPNLPPTCEELAARVKVLENAIKMMQEAVARS